ncbi:efflux RND transporter periplasmic adaptor subunit [Phenylobacterium sp.]|uniref:efflux RND transporter periplasmic adaptor subunit n=1 Tax=Phenylobacterium sp. TaxID=1871053 RepID=UPI00273054E9|nr:efflux RND transporter periplasmic adaptor subunit [Phenylobacterium sp.]MDP1875488.1 efflux RND transporter periplasmic adaptor subunit [Phenylobacterium sp.]MDP3489100.1 efflux RND transporter periplasmic adaptor subunit [Phenylobacterium sp.]
MRRLFVTAVCAVSIFGLAACGGDANPGQGMPTPTVSVAVPLQEEVVDWDDFTGRFEAPERVEVRARVGGYLQGVHFTDGQTVRKGQLLFTLDPRPAQAALAAAQAQADLARADLNRAEGLLEAQAISQEEFDSRRAQAQVAEATLRARRLDMEFTRVTAPVSGVVSQRQVDAGNVVSGGASSGDILTTIVSISPIHFAFDASEAQLLKYQRQVEQRQGAQVQVRLQDETERRWTGRLDFVDTLVDRDTGAVRLRATIANPNGFLKPGMFGQGRMVGADAYPALLIPETAIITDGVRRVAYVVDAEGTVQVKALELGPASDGLRVVRTGLRPDDQVVVGGQQRAMPGQKVEVTPGKIARQDVSGTDQPRLTSAPAASASPAN